MAGIFGSVTKQSMPVGYLGEAITAATNKVFQGRALMQALGRAAAEKQEYANIDLAETEERIANNQAQAERNNSYAFAQARQGRAVGGGTFRPRANRMPGSGALGAATAKARAEARRKNTKEKFRAMAFMPPAK